MTLLISNFPALLSSHAHSVSDVFSASFLPSSVCLSHFSSPLSFISPLSFFLLLLVFLSESPSLLKLWWQHKNTHANTDLLYNTIHIRNVYRTHKSALVHRSVYKKAASIHFFFFAAAKQLHFTVLVCECVRRKHVNAYEEIYLSCCFVTGLSLLFHLILKMFFI